MEKKKSELRKLNDSGEWELVEGNSSINYILELSKINQSVNTVLGSINSKLLPNTVLDSITKSNCFYSKSSLDWLSLVTLQANKLEALSLIDSIRISYEKLKELGGEINKKQSDIEKFVYKVSPKVADRYKIGIEQEEFIKDWIDSLKDNDFLKLTREELYNKLCDYAEIIVKDENELHNKRISGAKPKSRKTVTTEIKHKRYVEYYCRQRVDFGRDVKTSENNTRKEYKISLKTLNRAIKENQVILDTFKIK